MHDNLEFAAGRKELHVLAFLLGRARAAELDHKKVLLATRTCLTQTGASASKTFPRHNIKHTNMNSPCIRAHVKNGLRAPAGMLAVGRVHPRAR